MLAMQRQYESLVDDANKTNGPEAVAKYGLYNEKLDDMLHHIISSNLSSGDLRRLAATCGSLPKGDDEWRRFTRHVFGYMIESFVDSGDRDMVLKTISTRCPYCIGDWDYVETYLLSREDKVKEPILLFGEAYGMCRDPEVRRHIAVVVRRSFTASGVRGDDDAEFVRNAMQWYQKERGHLVRNPLRDLKIGKITFFDEDDPRMFRHKLRYDKMPPLFVERPREK
jgi:hypothetical protein